MVVHSTGIDDPDFYARLLRERYGPLARILAEAHPVGLPPAPVRRPGSTAVGVDPDAEVHRAVLEAALRARCRAAVAGRRHPPAPELPEAWSRACPSCRRVVVGGADAYRRHCEGDECEMRH